MHHYLISPGFLDVIGLGDHFNTILDSWQRFGSRIVSVVLLLNEKEPQTCMVSVVFTVHSCIYLFTNDFIISQNTMGVKNKNKTSYRTSAVHSFYFSQISVSLECFSWREVAACSLSWNQATQKSLPHKEIDLPLTGHR